MQLSLRHKKREAHSLRASSQQGTGEKGAREMEENRGVVVVKRAKSHKIKQVMVYSWREEGSGLMKVMPKSQKAAESCLLCRCQITPPGECALHLQHVRSHTKEQREGQNQPWDWVLQLHANILHLKTELGGQLSYDISTLLYVSKVLFIILHMAFTFDNFVPLASTCKSRSDKQ